jgi:hypothetical protein
MQYLPKITFIPMDIATKAYSVNDHTQYNQLCEIISEHINGDCWAVKLNNEILYNFYEPKGHRQRILDNMIRNEISENIHTSLFVNMFRNNQDGTIILYMFGEATWFMIINYIHKTECVTIEYYKTPLYDNLVENQNKKRKLIN